MSIMRSDQCYFANYDEPLMLDYTLYKPDHVIVDALTDFFSLCNSIMSYNKNILYIYLKKNRLIETKIFCDLYMLKNTPILLTTHCTISQTKNFDSQLLQVRGTISK